MSFERRQTKQIHVGKVPVGGGAPISIQSMTITKTADVGASMVMFNPIPESKHLDIEYTSENKTISAADSRVTVICITGPVTIKDKTLNSGQYAVVFANTSAELIQSDDTICALVTG